MHQVVHAGIWSAFPWIAYLVTVYLLCGKMPVWKTLSAGILVYLLLNTCVWLALRAHG